MQQKTFHDDHAKLALSDGSFLVKFNLQIWNKGSEKKHKVLYFFVTKNWSFVPTPHHNLDEQFWQRKIAQHSLKQSRLMSSKKEWELSEKDRALTIATFLYVFPTFGIPYSKVPTVVAPVLQRPVINLQNPQVQRYFKKLEKGKTIREKGSQAA